MAVSKRSKYTSKGSGRSVSKKISNAVRRDRSPADSLVFQINAWAKGKKTMVTIPNPNKNETNRLFIRVEGTHPAAFGPWKKDTSGAKSSND